MQHIADLDNINYRVDHMSLRCYSWEYEKNLQIISNGLVEILFMQKVFFLIQILFALDNRAGKIAETWEPSSQKEFISMKIFRIKNNI